MDVKIYRNPTGMLDQGDQEEKKGAYQYFCWFFQLGVWLMIILSIVLDSPTGAYIVLGIFYVIYLILEFCSSTSKYLGNKKNSQNMYESMGQNFRALPEIKFHGESYHYKTVHYTSRDNNGVHHHTRKEKVTTHKDTYTLPYYSERDVSGLFYLNCNMAYVRRKCYIKLNLEKEINFADEISCMDYENEKGYFWQRNRFRDSHFDFKETREIPGMKPHNLVKLGEHEPYFASYLYFSLFTLLTFSELYKSWFDSYCIYQKFKIRKLISTRYDLNQPAYQGLIPQLDCINQQYSYQPEYYNYINPHQKVQMPTPVELENAKKYQSWVPNYKTSNGYGSTQPGVVLDCPEYSYYDATQPPPAFAPIAGDVALGQDYINPTGEPPKGFGQPGFQFNLEPSAPSDGAEGFYFDNHPQPYPPPPNYSSLPPQYSPLPQYPPSQPYHS